MSSCTRQNKMKPCRCTRNIRARQENRWPWTLQNIRKVALHSSIWGSEFLRSAGRGRNGTQCCVPQGKGAANLSAPTAKPRRSGGKSHVMKAVRQPSSCAAATDKAQASGREDEATVVDIMTQPREIETCSQLPQQDDLGKVGPVAKISGRHDCGRVPRAV